MWVEMRKPSKFGQNFEFLNFKKPRTYVKHPYMNSFCTKFEGHRWKNDSVIYHASKPPKLPNLKYFKAKWPWRWRSRSLTMNRFWKLVRIHILCKFGKIPSKTFWLMVRTSPKWPNFERFKAKWPWRWRSRSPIINRLLKLYRIHMQTKFGVIPSDGFWLIVRTSFG